MEEPKKLLVIDNDFHACDTPLAINLAIDELRQEELRWAFYLQSQARGKEAIERGSYNALLIDNDSGEGMATLAGLVNGHGIGIPIGYVTAYDVRELVFQNIRLEQEGKPFVYVDDFQRFGVVHIRKSGNNVSKKLRLESLGKGLVNFLRFASQ